MSDLKARMREDRALRDASRALVDADVAHLRNTMSGKSLTERFVDRMSEGAVDVFEEAVEAADDHKGVLATLIAAVFLWFARNPISALFENDDHNTDGAAEEGTME